MVVGPRLRQSDSDAGSDPWFAGRRGAWAMWVGIASLLLIATGLWNYLQIIQLNEKMASSYHMLLGIKMLLALVVFFLAAVLAGKSGIAEQLRQKMKLWLGLCLITAVVVVALGSVLRTYPHNPKPLDGPALLAPAN
jgi:putative copper export protein